MLELMFKPLANCHLMGGPCYVKIHWSQRVQGCSRTAHGFFWWSPYFFRMKSPRFCHGRTPKKTSCQVASLLHYRGNFAFGELMHLAVFLAVPAIFVPSTGPSTKSGNEILNSCSNKVELETFDHHMIIMEPKNKSRIRGGSPGKMPESWFSSQKEYMWQAAQLQPPFKSDSPFVTVYNGFLSPQIIHFKPSPKISCSLLYKPSSSNPWPKSCAEVVS